MLCKKLIVIVGILFLGGVARVSAQEDSVRLSKELVRKMQNMPNIEVGKGITFEPKNKLYKMTLRFSPIIGGVKNTSQEYIFDKEKRESLTLVKDVIISETLFFSTEKKRQSVVTENEFGSFELNVYTKKLNNTVTFENGGYIELEYITEVKAYRVGYTKEYILVETV